LKEGEDPVIEADLSIKNHVDKLREVQEMSDGNRMIIHHHIQIKLNHRASVKKSKDRYHRK
jgi:hypothetical protein